MKNKLKYLLLLLIFLPCVFIFTACASVSVVDISKTGTTENYDVYTITYSNGKTSSFTVANGKDGNDLEIEEIYQAAKNNGYTGTFLEFLDDYLNLNADDDISTSVVSKSVLSAVSVAAEFPVISSVGFNQTKDTAVSSGSGVIYDLNKETGDAYIITNYHVVYYASSQTEDKIASSIKIVLYGDQVAKGYKVDEYNVKVKDADGYPVIEYLGNVIECEYIGGSMTNDIAVLKVSGSDVLKNSAAEEAKVANSDDVIVGVRGKKANIVIIKKFA